MRLTDAAIHRIATQLEAGLLEDAWSGIKRTVVPRLDAQEWWDELAQKLTALGRSIYDLESRDLDYWHEEGYSTDDVLQLEGV